MTNAHVQQLLRYEPWELTGQLLETLLLERFRSQHLEHRAAYPSDRHSRAMGANLTLFVARKDGTEVPVLGVLVGSASSVVT